MAGQAGEQLDSWEAVLDDTNRPIEPTDLDHYSNLVNCYSDINSHVEARRQDLVNVEGFAQNILARGENLLKRYHERLSNELGGSRRRCNAFA